MVMCVHFIKKKEKGWILYIHRFAKKANDLFSLLNPPPPTEIKLPGKTLHISIQPKHTHTHTKKKTNRQQAVQHNGFN